MNKEVLLSELEFTAVRSSGPGGQHVNKTSSKVILQYNIESSEALSEAEKELLKERLKKRITSEGLILLSCSESRSQHRNKAIVIAKLFELLEKNLKVRKKRKKSKPSKKAIEKRLKEKRDQAMKKARRKKPPTD